MNRSDDTLLTTVYLTQLSHSPTRILYCRCAFAQVVPESTKNTVLETLCQSGFSFECVSDLCEMAARKDSRLKEIVEAGGTVRVAACYPRAVKWLFHHAEAPLPDDGSVEIFNMRDTGAEEICAALLKTNEK